MKWYILVAGKDFEYQCNDCGQFRLCCRHPFAGCGNCGSNNITKGAVGTLVRKDV